MKKICIYEPAMCCETGICGVSVDPELISISTTLNTLKNQGIEISRFNLNSAPMEFVKSDTVNKYINEKGVEGLPCVTLDGEIVIGGRYPTNAEILKLLELSAEYLLPKGATECCTTGCCEPTDTDCCSDGCCEPTDTECCSNGCC